MVRQVKAERGARTITTVIFSTTPTEYGKLAKVNGDAQDHGLTL